MKNKFITLILVLLASSAQAQYEMNHSYHNKKHGNCVSQYITKLSEKITLFKGCEQTEDLELSWTIQNYPHLKENPRRVQYWKGSYTKIYALTSNYLKELVDTCKGKIISKTQFSDVQYYDKIFKLKNLNLDVSIKESFMLVPMTEAEAKQELIEANYRCLDFKIDL